MNADRLRGEAVVVVQAAEDRPGHQLGVLAVLPAETRPLELALEDSQLLAKGGDLEEQVGAASKAAAKGRQQQVEHGRL